MSNQRYTALSLTLRAWLLALFVWGSVLGTNTRECCAQRPSIKTKPPTKVPAVKPPQAKTEAAKPADNAVATTDAKQVYLDDLQAKSFGTIFGKLGLHGSTGYPEPHAQRVRLRGNDVEHSLAVVPTEGKSAFIEYELEGKFQLFRTTAALNTPTAKDGLRQAQQDKWTGSAGSPITFRVIGDGKTLWESKQMQKLGSLQECEVQIEGVNKLRLEIDCAGSSFFAWSYWANPLVIKATAPPATPPADKPATTPQSAPTTATPTPTTPEKTPTTEPPANPPAQPAVDPQLVTYQAIKLSEPTTEIAMTDDGRFLIASHESADLISVWDIVNQKILKTIKTPAPRAVICRGDKVFVSNFGKGTISLFARNKNWQLQNQFEVEKKRIVLISAPQGEYFKDELVVTCHEDGPEGSYRGNALYVVDTKRDKHQAISGRGLVFGSCLATVSYDGKIILGQDSFNLSPGGGVYGYPYAEYLKGSKQSLFNSGTDMVYLTQFHPGSYWYGSGWVLGNGASFKRIDRELGLIIPDLAQRVVYPQSHTELIACRLDSAFSEIARRKVKFPSASDGKSTAFDGANYGGRHRSYHLDSPLAFTHNGQLDLFFLSGTDNQVYTARTPAFVVPSEKGALEIAAKSDAAGSPPPSTSPAKEPAIDEWGLPTQIVDGTKLKVTMKSPGKAEFELLTGPEGMELSKSGELTWEAKPTDIGQHTLKVRIAVGDSVTIVRPKIEVVDHELVASNGGSLQGLEKGERLALEIDNLQFTAARNHSSLLVLQGERVRELGPDGLKVIHDHKLPNRYSHIAARGDDYIALASSPNELDLINSKTGKARKSIPLEVAGFRIMKLMDMVPHPSKPITYVAVEHDVQFPRYRVLIVNESKGKVEVSEEVIGTWLQIDPTGRYLYAGYKDLYRKGSQLHINPGFNVVEIPRYGNIDWLLSYDLRGTKPKIHEGIQDAGGNGSGIVMSADGKRITYLSHVGTPLHSGNLVGWNSTKIKDKPVTYKVSGKGSPNALAFHPTLPMVAIPGSGSAVFFNRETGAEMKDKLQLTSQGLGDTKVEQALFSPNGSALIFVCSDGDGRYLRRVTLRLNKDESAIAARGVSASPASSEEAGGPQDLIAKKNLLKVNESEIDSLKSKVPTETLTPKEISKRYSDSVVVIKSDEGSGTGFVVGKNGYIFTCAHVIPDDGNVSVAYTIADGAHKKTKTSKAKVVRIEPDRDLALLKIESPALAPVLLGAETPVESGEDVTVIGNPGLGEEILTHTITTGIVSSPKRVLDDQEYIQTSAVVNPGNSGGPMFDSHGCVVGLVVAKAVENEATTFAVPARILRKFLDDATISKK